LGWNFIGISLLFIILLQGSFSREWWNVIFTFLLMRLSIGYGVYEFAQMVFPVNKSTFIINHTHFALILSISLLGMQKKTTSTCINIGGVIGIKDWYF